ncbi:MAG: hypothetical protein K2O49_00980 [Muribaculaceae bacterium]|nr:hypothetical protein [Muribaculaceae bacterium]
MTPVIIIVIIILVWLIFGARIRAWLTRRINNFIANRTEDFIRKAAGMPPRDKSESKRRKTERTGDERTRRSSQRRRGRSRDEYYSRGPIIPKEYAEDVEFVEIKEFSQTDIEARFNDKETVEYHESQVSDVEWVEIKTDDAISRKGKKR